MNGAVSGRIRWPDAAVAVAVAGLVVVGTSHLERGAAVRPVDGLAVACGVVGALALAGWRRFPLGVAAVVVTTMFVYLARGYPGGPALLPGPLSMVALGVRAPRPVALAGAAAAALAAIGGHWIGRGDLGAAALIGTGWAVAGVLAGQVVAARTERAAAARERARLERREALAGERLRIARDLHDTVAHAMATINVQSGVAAHLLERRPEQVRVALEAIRSASRDVLDEMTAILAALRDDESDGMAPRAPVPGLDRLDDLVARTRADGLTVLSSVDGDLASVSPAVSAAAYRVVQEALSNIRRHAGAGATATVRVHAAGRGRLAVDVVDDGGSPRPTPGGGVAAPPAGTRVVSPRSTPGGRVAGPPAGTRVGAGPGLGLVGMRERVESTGGTLIAEPGTAGSGFRVRAEWTGEP